MRSATRIRVFPALVFFVAAGSAVPAPADESGWSIELQAILMEVSGHDPHVLTVHRQDLAGTPSLESRTAENLETDSGLAYRGDLRYTRGKWGFGLDFLSVRVSQNLSRSTAAAGSGEGVVFEVPARRFVSSDPGEVLYFERLEDTDLAMWTVDLYAMRSLAEGEKSRAYLLFGLRNADFDNDYHAAVGIEGSRGVLLDASSNYGRMMGPMVAVGGEIRFGRSSIEGRLGQSVVLGEAEPFSMSRDFVGPFGESPAFVAQRTFGTTLDVSIPISELRLRWRYDLAKRWSVGLGAEASTWWDVPVPPGVVPVPDGDRLLRQSTIVFLGLQAGVTFRF